MRNCKSQKTTTRKKRHRELAPDFTVFVAPRLLRRGAAAAHLSISTSALDCYRAQGLIREVPMPAVRGNGELRTPLFDRVDLDLLVERLKGGEL